MKTAPCKGCEKRQPYCHSCCNDYAAFRKEVKAIREEERKVRLVNDAIKDDIYRLKKTRRDRRPKK